ncbi:MAG: hypothetical protein AAF747_07580 [Planctomycetota bacterium]
MTRFTRKPLGAAFTLTELVVVMAIIVVLVAVSVPAFRSMLTSVGRASAETSLRVGVAGARDLAIRSGEDTVAAFFFEPQGKTTIVAAVRVGEIEDQSPDAATNTVVPTTAFFPQREIFVATPEVIPVQLPENWMVRGLALEGTAGEGNLRVGNAQTNGGWYAEQHYREADHNWVFPETGFIQPPTNPVVGTGELRGGELRQTFVIRFKGGTGQIDPSDNSDLLIYAPIGSIDRSQSVTFNRDLTGNDGFFGAVLLPVDESASLVEELPSYIERAKAVVPSGGSITPESYLTELFGDESIDSVLARPVEVIALYNELELVRGLARFDIGDGQLNDATDTLYTDATQPAAPVIMAEIDSWIRGDTNGNGVAVADETGVIDEEDRPRARLYAIVPNRGTLRETLPSIFVDETAGGGGGPNP